MKDIKAKHTISNLETLRVIADPLRGQILELLGLEQLTVKQVAQRLGLAPSKLYYHVNQMEKHGLIQLVETRMVANLQEKYYRAIAYSFDVDPELLTFKTMSGQDSVFKLVESTLDTTREDILRTMQARLPYSEKAGPEDKGHRLMLTRHLSHLTEAQADKFFEQLQTLLAEYDLIDGRNTSEPSIPYGLTLAFYPSLYYEEEE